MVGATPYMCAALRTAAPPDADIISPPVPSFHIAPAPAGIRPTTLGRQFELVRTLPCAIGEPFSSSLHPCWPVTFATAHAKRSNAAVHVRALPLNFCIHRGFRLYRLSSFMIWSTDCTACTTCKTRSSRENKARRLLCEAQRKPLEMRPPSSSHMLKRLQSLCRDMSQSTSNRTSKAYRWAQVSSCECSHPE